MKSPKRHLTWILLGIAGLTAIIIAGYFYLDRVLSNPIEIKNIKVDPNAALKLNIFKQISQKNGIKEWELTAKTATLLKDENKAILEDVAVVFFTRDNKEVHLTSKEGEINTKTHDMACTTDVVVTFETSVLKTQTLHYSQKEHIIRAVSHVVVERPDAVIEADSMTTYLNENLIILEGHVKGQFSENFRLQ